MECKITAFGLSFGFLGQLSFYERIVIAHSKK